MVRMKLIAQVKLKTTQEQANALKRTLECANAARNYISRKAWNHKTFGQYKLHHLTYREVREKFGLTAQMTVRCIASVADAYKIDCKTKRIFKPTSAIAYDDRILRWNLDKSGVSIWTLDGRLHVPFVCGNRQRELLFSQQGETDLILFRDKFFLSATCNVEEPDPIDVEGVLGVDLGIVNIAVTSDGDIMSGSAVNNIRHRHRRLRAKLQSKGTRAARRRLKKLSGREARFARHTNHVMSKRIVAIAQGTHRAIALEDLGGLRDRVRLRRDQRVTLHSWSFHQLGQFIEYKAQRAGVMVVRVNPRNTSRTCPECGCIDKRNRPSQETFLCVSCGFSGFADHIAAGVIAHRAIVNSPIFPASSELRRLREGKASPQVAR
jgi:IS605 OrfB family transposase